MAPIASRPRISGTLKQALMPAASAATLHAGKRLSEAVSSTVTGDRVAQALTQAVLEVVRRAHEGVGGTDAGALRVVDEGDAGADRVGRGLLRDLREEVHGMLRGLLRQRQAADAAQGGTQLAGEGKGIHQ